MVKGIETKTGIEAAREAKDTFDKLRKCPHCGRKYADLVITDVPVKALNQFKKLANEEFKPKGGSAHYGFTIKFLLDFYFGKIVDGATIAQELANEALEQIAEMRKEQADSTESEKEEQNPKVRKMLDGTERRCF